MYHYVFDSKSPFSANLHFFPADKFEEQLLYLKKTHNVIDGETLIDAIIEKAPLPPNAVLLTFDDGYIDHYRLVLPILNRYRLKACFFPIGMCVNHRRLLDVNKIHLILARCPDIGLLNGLLFSALDKHRQQYELPSEDFFIKKLEHEKLFFDTKEVIIFKRMLQRELPEHLRSIITNDIFCRFVSCDEADIAEQFYMGGGHIRHLHQAGMTIGNHGFSHLWYSRISPEQQEKDIDASLAFLDGLSVLNGNRQWVFSFPFGDYNRDLLSIIERKGCVAGLTTESRIAALASDNSFLLPRMDIVQIKLPPC